MDNNVFIIVYLAVSVTVCLSSIIIALYRKRTHLVIFALSFLYFLIASVLFSTQNESIPILSIVLGNLIHLLAVLMQFASVRAYFDSGRIWPRRFYIYIAVLLLTLINTALINYSIIACYVLLSVIFTSIYVDFLLFLGKQFKSMSAPIKSLLVSAVLTSALSYILRAFLVLAIAFSSTLHISNALFNTYVFIAYAVTSFLWFAAIILIDDYEIVTEMNSQEEKYRLLAESTTDVIWVYDINKYKLTYVSPSVFSLLGYTQEELLSETLADMMSEDSYTKLKKLIDDAQNDSIEAYFHTIPRYIEIQMRCKDGKLKWVEISLNIRFLKNGVPDIVGVTRDINERKKKEDIIDYLNNHDPFTGLFNRNALRDLTMDADSLSQHAGKRSVIFVDIDNFRVINDSLGHIVGDKFISEIAAKLKNCIGTSGLIFRYYGDEFIIIIDSIDTELIQNLCKEIQEAVNTQIMLGDRSFYLTASIGYCIGQKDEEIEDTISKADTALYIAKRTKNTVQAYSYKMDKTKTKEILLEQDIKHALNRNELIIYYQPVVETKSGNVVSSEALLRWEHPELGRVSPADFIQISERTRNIIPITEWVIEEVCKQIVAWKSRNLKICVGINLSPVCIENRETQFKKHLIDALERYHLGTDEIKLEITEATFMKNLEETIKVCHELRAAGISLSLDDFGTGYSSFGYIKDIPLSSIKLDRSFIGLIDSDKKEQTIVEGMIKIAHGLGLAVVAEGVETYKQFSMLCEYNCDYIQGFFYSKPMAPEDFEGYCRSGDSKKKICPKNLIFKALKTAKE